LLDAHVSATGGPVKFSLLEVYELASAWVAGVADPERGLPRKLNQSK
jgi:hypothetical protein